MEEWRPQTTELGKLEGPVLVFGGPYSNLQALEAVQAVARSLGIPSHNIICTGDVVGYCAQPAECIALIQDWGIHTIAGNVERSLRAGADDCGCDFNEGGRCDLFSRTWYAYAKAQIDNAEQAWMAALPDFLRFGYAGKSCVVLHGSAFGVADYIFRSTPWEEKQKTLEATRADLVIAGHSGLPFVQEVEACTWLNAGAIGMPANDGDTRVWYALLTDEDSSAGPRASLHRLAYDYTAAALHMRRAGLPAAYAKTLETGIWDNCEILPTMEAAQQGRPIMLEEYP